MCPGITPSRTSFASTNPSHDRLWATMNAPLRRFQSKSFGWPAHANPVTGDTHQIDVALRVVQVVPRAERADVEALRVEGFEIHRDDRSDVGIIGSHVPCPVWNFATSGSPHGQPHGPRRSSRGTTSSARSAARQSPASSEASPEIARSAKRAAVVLRTSGQQNQRRVGRFLGEAGWKARDGGASSIGLRSSRIA